jgi:transcriptional regulator with XRE-family HTH domain
MLYALAIHDIATVYRLLQRFGVSQRQIAARTVQTQSEISEILSGRRVVAYDVLVRISEGLGVPRGWMGLEYTYPDESGEIPNLPSRASSLQPEAHADQTSTRAELSKPID